MSTLQSCADWANELFSKCDLGDRRRTKRLIQVAKQLAGKIGRSLANTCDGNMALVEGAYRLVRNDKISSEAIGQGVFQSTAEKAQQHKLLLALEDTTSFNFTHEAEGLESSKNNNGNVRGFYAHSVLLVDPVEEKTVGLIAQNRWQRKVSQRGKRYQLKERCYEEKESFKWQKASESMSEVLDSKMRDIISVCDREADIYEYLDYKRENQQRFVVRAVRNRRLEMIDETISDALRASDILGHCEVEIPQKSGRKARTATLALRSCRVTLKGVNRGKQYLEEQEVNVVAATAMGKAKNDSQKLSWVILTSEPAGCFGEAKNIIHYYEMRWRIEEYHKAWKTGAGAERQRMQTAKNLEKMIVLLGVVAVRLLQLREGFESTGVNKKMDVERSCTEVLTKEEFVVLWFAVEKKKSLPKKPPALSWAYKSIAKLGGWSDSKRTGKASWLTIWEGWYRLQERTEGYLAAKNLSDL